MRRAVITGLGIVSALGVGRENCWRRLLDGRSGLRPLSRIDTTGLRNELGGEVPEDEWAPHADAEPRAVGYARFAVAEALAQAGLTDAVARVYATNFGGQEAWRTETDEAVRHARLDFHRAATDPGAMLAVTLSNACSSGTHALGHAADLVRLGLCDAAVACGFDELDPFCLSGLSILHTITTDTIRPFDIKRSGTIFGEGAGALVVEEYDRARARGADILAEVVGYGVNNNAFHMTAPDKGGQGMVHAIGLALAQSGCDPGAIDHVNAHATGTEYHDPAETEALKTALGAHAYEVPISAIKAATGHPMGAAGAIEAVACVLALRDGVVPPTLNLDEPDPACDLDYVPGAARPAAIKLALSVSAGLGGNNAAALLRRV